MVIGVFGGTFDPPHLGHLGVADRVISSGLADEVWFIPCRDHRFGKTPAPYDARLAMCRLLINGREGMRVSDIESTLARPGYTYDLVVTLKDTYPDHAFRLIAGADVYHERDKWHRYDEIARLAPPIYLAREGVPPIDLPALEAPIGASATTIRERLRSGKGPLDLVPAAVLDYIAQHGLYRRAM
ncbi:MAG: nicotinate-nicotinamide nucleotide adenylyltransferase [Myxococcota bacterium]|nr:nicotinate-nicotinamide nucleotide adenylyltransferase [Myxococcota bacterium]